MQVVRCCTLHSLDAVETRLPLLRPDHPLVGGQEHVLDPGDGDSVHGELLGAGVPVQDHLQLRRSHLRAGVSPPPLDSVLDAKSDQRCKNPS